jgi:hypothetical protein
VTIPSFPGHVHRIIAFLHKSSTDSSTETISESPVPVSEQRPSSKGARSTAGTPDAASQRSRQIPLATGPGRPLARWRAWRPAPRSATCRRRGSSAGPPAAGTMTTATHGRHNSRHARPGAVLTARSSTAPGPAAETY